MINDLPELLHSIVVCFRGCAAFLESEVDTRRRRQRCGHARRRRVKGLFKYKKDEGCNRLISFNPKRPNRTVMRQNETADRQKSLALLSLVCQCLDS